MKTFRLIAATFVFAAIFAVSAFAQTTTAIPTTGKIVVINTSAFGDAKAGINKYVSAVSGLNTEFKTLDTELNGMEVQAEKLEKEIANLRQLVIDKKADEKSYNDKVDQLKTLATSYKRKKEDADAKYTKRQQEVLAPIQEDIGKAIDAFAKEKGYGLILDVARMFTSGMVLNWDGKTADVTTEFVTYYNTRSTTNAVKTTSTTTTKQ